MDAMQAWLRADRPSMIDGVALLPRTSEGAANLPRCTVSETAISYHLFDKNDDGWILKKFMPDWQPDLTRIQTTQYVIPRMPGFKSGFDQRVLDETSLSPAGYHTEELQTWLINAVLVPEVTGSTWSDVADSIRAGGQSLSTIVKLLLCQKLSERVEWLESAGVAHRNLSATSVLIDPLNVEVHFVDWEHLFHPSLSKPASTTSECVGYIAPFVRPDAGADATWRARADRFALAVLNCEILLTNGDSPVTTGGGLLEQQHIFDRAGQTLQRLRSALQQNSPAALKLFDQCLTASNFDQCPGPREWLALIERELNNDAEKAWDEPLPAAEQTQSIYDPPQEPGFVRIKESAFVKINRAAFVSAPRSRRY
ncbi:MAG TPA: hypothetical protein VFS77_08850 [Pyrinomonadaceae bacterium]|nr:hypothetical protein [Pyrinomonadaceae bacterium]